jgi:NADPH-dependent ferric siderophore reductase
MTSTSTAVDSPMLCFDVEVVAVRRLSPAFVRVTFGGACLEDLDGGGALGPRDQRVKLIFPLPGGRVRTPELLTAGWYPRWLALDPAERGEMRTYTVRRTRLEGPRPEVDVDFVLHTPSGPAGSWAAAARPGDRLSLLGPRRGRAEDYLGIEWSPPAPENGPVLLAGDETAVPAVASILETLPSSYVATAVLEVPHAEDFAELSSAAMVSTTWLARGSRPRGQLLGQAVREAVAPYASGLRQEGRETVPDVDVEETILWETPVDGRVAGTPYVWVAAEAAVVRDIRRHLVTDVGLPRANVAFMGYWREGRAL